MTKNPRCKPGDEKQADFTPSAFFGLLAAAYDNTVTVVVQIRFFSGSPTFSQLLGYGQEVKISQDFSVFLREKFTPPAKQKRRDLPISRATPRIVDGG